jgi:cytoplasmic iron level regulating protein YaaA (DUF328/UPF0246 family)
MLILISPAKSLSFEKQDITDVKTKPVFQSDASKLIKTLKGFSVKEIQDLMGISYDLAKLNFDRHKNWKFRVNKDQTKQALLAFTGEVFRGLQADKMKEEDLHYAQDHLRILSGLYGVLRPLDAIQAYRLEMGIKLKHEEFKNLYQFWNDKITNKVNSALDGSKIIVNLASNEYYKSIKPNKLKANIITPVFKDYKNGVLKVITVYAKNSRGQMARFIIKNRIEDAEEIKAFDVNRYQYDENSSDENTWVFVR